MAKDNVGQWDTNPDANTDVGGNNIAENCPPSTINNAIRSVMAQIRTFYNNTGRLDAANIFTGANSFTGSSAFSGASTFTSTVSIANNPLTMAAGSGQATSLRGVKFQIDGVEVASLIQENTGFAANVSSYLRGSIDGTEHFRAIPSSFNFGFTSQQVTVADTGVGVSISYGGLLWANRVNAVTAILKRTGGDGAVMQFGRDTTAVGTISVTASATAYNTSSDGRLKTDLQPIAADLLDSIHVYDYAWKNGSGRAYGAIAQELADVIPQAVSKGESPEDMWSVDYSKLVPILIASVQGLRARISRLESDAS